MYILYIPNYVHFIWLAFGVSVFNGPDTMKNIKIVNSVSREDKSNEDAQVICMILYTVTCQ